MADQNKRETILGFLESMYGNSIRKGINKLAYQHPLDVLENCFLERLDTDLKRKVRIFKAALLHDVGEDSGVELAELQIRLHLKDRDVQLIKLLSRNIPNEDGSDYLTGIMQDEDAIIVKLADRLANMEDLFLWVDNENSFNEDSLKIAEKYLKENDLILERLSTMYPDLNEIKDSPIPCQYEQLKTLQCELEQRLKCI